MHEQAAVVRYTATTALLSDEERLEGCMTLDGQLHLTVLVWQTMGDRDGGSGRAVRRSTLPVIWARLPLDSVIGHQVQTWSRRGSKASVRSQPWQVSSGN